jgi:hypothetical protein
MKFSVYTILLLSTAASGFNIPNPFAGVMLAPTEGNVLLSNNNKGVLKQQILEAISSTSEGAFQWVMQAPVLLFKDSAVFSTESDK